ncbi:LPS assembly protein LptD, partial [Paracoccaceae bacterium]|nr:LPS assembly protein LptD [Paracoccaceae bacterium]
TPCDICILNPRPSWMLKSERLIHNSKTKKLHFYNTWLEIFGVPVIYTPYLQTPEPGVKRASGLLAPSFLSSDLLGTGVRQPIFFTIGNASDFTFSVVKTSKIDLLIESQYRKLFKLGDLTLESAFLPSSSDESIKGFMKIKGSSRLDYSTFLNIDTTLISDTSFLGKYGYDDRDRFLNLISYRKFSNNKSLQASVLYHTSLRDSNTVEPLVLPDLRYRKLTKFQKSGLLLLEKYSLVGISRREENGYGRLSADLEISKSLQTDSGLLVRGTGNILAAAYIENKMNEKSNLLKVYPMGALEFKYPLFKNNTKKSEIFIPIAQLVYSTDTSSPVDPTDEDSSTTEFDSTSLFKLRKIPGIDRQEKGLRLNAGLQYFHDYKNNYKYSVSLGQVYRNKNSKDFLLSSGLNGYESDILLSGNISFKRDLDISSKQVYSKNFSLKRSDTSLKLTKTRYQINTSLVNLISDPSEGTSADLKELTLNINSNLTKNWSGKIGLRRNMVNNENINTSVGFNFKNECIDIDLSLSRRNTATNLLPRDSRIDLVVNFGNIGLRYGNSKMSKCVIK